MAKNGSKEWHKDKLEAAKAEIQQLKAELAAPKEEAPKEETADLALDLSLLSDRRVSAIRKFLYTSERYSRKTHGQILAAAIAYLADGTRKTHVSGLMAELKRLKGSGLR